jgi:hypothetical protein
MSMSDLGKSKMFQPILIRVLAGALVIGVSGAYANCDSPIDLTEKSPQSSLPSGEQGDSYTCGFFAAATYLDFYRIRQQGALDSLPIDPVALAIDLAIERDRPRWLPFQITSDPLSVKAGRRGALFCDIISHARTKQVCDHQDFRVFDRAWTTKRTNQALALYALLDNFADLREAEQASRLRALSKDVKTLVREDPIGEKSDEAIGRIIWTNRDKPYRVLQSLLYAECATRRAGPAFSRMPDCTYEWFTPLGSVGNGFKKSRAARIEKAINEGLEMEGALPVPVGHCFQVLHEGRAYRGSNPIGSSCIFHYVNVIGRRKKAGTCQFLIRNSYDPAAGEDAVSPDWERRGDDFWVDSRTFSESAYALHWLED